MAGDRAIGFRGAAAALCDNITAEGVETRASSRMLEGYVPVFSAAAVEILQGAGAELHPVSGSEFGFSDFRGDDYRAAARAVAERAALLGLDSGPDGGVTLSVEGLPVFALRPTLGAFSRHGLIAASSSADGVGVIARDGNTLAAAYDLLAVKDPRDILSQGAREPGVGAACDLKTITVGLPKGWDEGLSEERQRAVKSALDALTARGAAAVEIDLPLAAYAPQVLLVLRCAEATSNLGKLDGMQYGYRTASYRGIDELLVKTRGEGLGELVKRRLLFGNFCLSAKQFDAYFKKAYDLRGAIAAELAGALSRCDVILTPTAADFQGIGDDDRRYHEAVRFAAPGVLAGLPAVGVPGGVALTGAKFSEGRLIAMAGVLESLAGRGTL